MEPLTLPDSKSDSESAWTDWLEERGRGGLRTAADDIAALKIAPTGDPAVLELWNDAAIAVSNASAACSLLSSVHPDPAVIELAEQIELEVEAFGTDLYLDAEVHAQLAALADADLDEPAQRVLTLALRAFRRQGVHLDEDVRARVRDLDRRLTDLGQAFGRNIRDGRQEARVTPEALAGLPADWVEAHPVGEDGLVAVSTDYPDTHPFLRFSTDADARREVATTFFNLGWPANEEVLTELLGLRHEKATLLGYPDWPSYDAEVKMLGAGRSDGGPAIGAFIDDIAGRAEGPARRDLQVLLDRAGRDGVDRIDLSNSRYYLDTVKREQYQVDAQEVRRYFRFDRVHDGLLDVTGRLFGVRYEPVQVPVWHEDVSSYDVHLGDQRLGRIHLDLHPRARKYNHAAQFTLVNGVRDRQLPEGVLVCNFGRGLMEHSEVVTLFHEFGHLLHHVLAGRHEWVRFAGVATEWDFVEAPSQLLEEWAWDHAVLAGFARDEDGTAIPAELVARMRAAEEFAKGLLARTQMFYAALAYEFHRDRPADLTGRMLELYDRYSLVRPLPDTHFYAGFGHLDGYTSAYYTYMWSLVIAKDLLSAFDRENLMAPEVAARYRDRILAPGGSGDAADLVADFLGRPYDFAAFADWLNG